MPAPRSAEKKKEHERHTSYITMTFDLFQTDLLSVLEEPFFSLSSALRREADVHPTPLLALLDRRDVEAVAVVEDVVDLLEFLVAQVLVVLQTALRDHVFQE